MKKLRNFLLRACVLAGLCSMSLPAQQHRAVVCKEELVELLRQADRERDWVHALLDKAEVDAHSFSIDQIKATLAKLEAHKESLMTMQDGGKNFDASARRYLLLVQELIRQLTNARIAYENRVKTTESVKRAAVPLGVGAAVAGGLLVVDMIADIGIDVSTALLSGAAAGAAAGVITYRGEVAQAASDLKSMVSDVFNDRKVLKDVGTVAASVAGAAALSGLLWHQRDTLLGLLGVQATVPRSLADVAKDNGLGH